MPFSSRHAGSATKPARWTWCLTARSRFPLFDAIRRRKGSAPHSQKGNTFKVTRKTPALAWWHKSLRWAFWYVLWLDLGLCLPKGNNLISPVIPRNPPQLSGQSCCRETWVACESAPEPQQFTGLNFKTKQKQKWSHFEKLCMHCGSSKRESQPCVHIPQMQWLAGDSYGTRHPKQSQPPALIDMPGLWRLLVCLSLLLFEAPGLYS